ncbi:MAG TPA: IS21-like element helper ATPase IstB [Methanosarcinales archaeon]|nr:IS21-like element helper ATPase IstB [Methanosarcinales archaeon]
MANNQATLQKLNSMNLKGIARALKAAIETGITFTADEFIAHLVDAEWDDRYNRRLERLIKEAKFRYKASIEEIDFSLARNLDKNMILRFSDCSWIKDKKNIIITGPTGVGKSFVASALGNQACIYGYRTYYFNSSKLFSYLKASKADGTYVKNLEKIAKSANLVFDDFGLEKLDSQSRLSLLEILEDRHGLASTIIASQIPISSWHDIIGDATIADAICDRIVNNSYRIELKGESIRKKYNKNN